jgi:hypothetical protein
MLLALEMSGGAVVKNTEEPGYVFKTATAGDPDCFREKGRLSSEI